MKINLPISNFKFEDNKIYINESVVEYSEVSEDNKEILESLISKGAYGSALLTLNLLYDVKKINESDYTNEEYLSYINECNKLMKECVVETSTHNFKPLINLNGLEIMESEDHIARGKGDVLLVEDFRLKEECEGTQASDIAEKKDQEVGQLQTVKKKRKKKAVMEEGKDFTPSEIDKYVASYNSKTGSNKTKEDFEWLYMAGQVDGFKIRMSMKLNFTLSQDTGV